jgi:hypothetical protein
MIAEPTFFQVLQSYWKDTVSYWWLLLLCVTMPFIDLINWHLPEGWKLRFKPWQRLSITFVLLSVAQFLAYRNSQLNLTQVIDEKRQFSMKINYLQSELDKRKEKAVVEIASFGYDTNPDNEMEVVATIHARNVNPGIARNVHGTAALLPAPFMRDITANQIIQSMGFQAMLKGFRAERLAHGPSDGPSLALGQSQDYVAVPVVLTKKQYEDWKHYTEVVYLLGEVIWQDEAGEWKTDICRLLPIPRKVGNTPLRVAGTSVCDGYNGIAEPFTELRQP